MIIYVYFPISAACLVKTSDPFQSCHHVIMFLCLLLLLLLLLLFLFLLLIVDC